jgi:p-hydroxybenzoate 3-monooxygenase
VERTRTQVGIVGAGPAGLMLSHLLHLAGVDSVVLEDRARSYVETRVRAGVLEQGSVDLLRDSGVGERMLAEGAVHDGVNLQFDGERHRIDFARLTGKRITVYGQQEVVKDLIAARLAAGGTIRFEVGDVRPEAVTTDSPVIRFSHDGAEHELRCEFVAGCDGFHGVCREVIPAAVRREYAKEYPFAWLGVLAAVAPSTDELIYAYHERGFALHSMRSPELSRLYVQVRPDEELSAWPDARIWDELRLRLASDGFTLHEGPLVERGIATMRSFVCEPMQHGRLYLAGDAAHIVPPTGAKGMNLALADVAVLARAVAQWFDKGDRDALDAYSDTCLKRVWRVQDFSMLMTELMHRLPDADPFASGVQRARQRYLATSAAMRTTIAENYVGLPIGGPSTDPR